MVFIISLVNVTYTRYREQLKHNEPIKVVHHMRLKTYLCYNVASDIWWCQSNNLVHWSTGERMVRMHINMLYELRAIVWLTEWHKTVRIAHYNGHGCHDGTKKKLFNVLEWSQKATRPFTWVVHGRTDEK